MSYPRCFSTETVSFADSGFRLGKGRRGSEAGRWWGEKVTPEALGSGPGSTAEAELQATRCLPGAGSLCAAQGSGRDREVTLRAGVWAAARRSNAGPDSARVKAFPFPPLAPPKSPARALGAGPALPPALTGRWEGEAGGGLLPAGCPPIAAPECGPARPPDSAAGRWAFCWLAHFLELGSPPAIFRCKAFPGSWEGG